MTTIYLQTDIADSDSPHGTAQALSRHAASPVRLVNDRLIAAAPALRALWDRFIAECDAAKTRGHVLSTREGRYLDDAIRLLASIDGQTEPRS